MPFQNNTNNFNETTENFANLLTTYSNNTVQRGLFYRVDIFELCNQGKVPSCFGVNSDNPYFTCAMDLAPGQTVPNYVEVENGKHMSFRIGFNEAIVIIGKTPPEVDYFSYCTFLNTRHANNGTNNSNLLEIHPIRNKPKAMERKRIRREVLFGCLGEPINSLKINTPGTPNSTLGCPYDQPFLIVITGNKDLQEEIYQYALYAGMSSDSLNTLPIPMDIARLGVNSPDTDTFAITNRIANHEKNNPKFKEYVENPDVEVFRVTSNRMQGAAFLSPYLTPRGTGRTELKYSNAIEELKRNIISYYDNEYDAVEVPSDIWAEESHMTIQQGVNNLGEARDSNYFATGSFVLPKDAFVVVYGANHAKTGKCTYSNVVAYGTTYDNGVASVNNHEFENSAYKYWNDPDAGYLYAWRFGYHDDSSEDYTKIPTQLVNKVNSRYNRDTHYIDPEEEIYFGFRAYMEPITKVGPAYYEMILDKAIVFLKRK